MSLSRRGSLVLAVAVLGAGGRLGCAVPAPEAPAPGLAWIDAHVHLLGGSRGDFGGAARAALAAMDAAGIARVVVMPPPQVSGGRGLFDWRDFVGALAVAPTRFAFLGGGGTLNPIIVDHAGETTIDDRTRAAFTRLAEEIIAGGAAGFGEIAAHHLSVMSGHPYEVVAPDHGLLRLLADVAARHGAVIDLHLDLVVADMPPPARFASPHNPAMLRENLAAFERLLAYNRGAKIVWAHAGSDPIGQWTPALSRALLGRHPNLYMSLRMPARVRGPMPGGLPPNLAVGAAGEVNAEWVELVRQHPDRFVIGGDQFFASPTMSGTGPGVLFAQLAPTAREMIRRFLAALPPDVGRRVASENALRLYRLARAP